MDMNLIYESERISNELIELRRKFHENPELDFDLHITSQIIKEFLAKEGIDFFSCAGTGVVATIYGEAEGSEDRTIAIRCDMDALPMEEKNEAIYRSKIPGRMHRRKQPTKRGHVLDGRRKSRSNTASSPVPSVSASSIF